MAAALWWIRRDLRLADNPALATALESGAPVIPAFVLDPALLGSDYVGEKRLAFLWGGLRRLEADLRRRGGGLILRRGDPVEALSALVQETGAETILAEADYSPYARRRDAAVARRLPLKLVGGPALRLPGDVLKKDGKPYVVFTPFMRAWKALPLPRLDEALPAPDRLETPAALRSKPFPPVPESLQQAGFDPGEAEAQRRLETFVGGSDPAIYRYGELRDRLDLDGTSHLSPYLRFGMLSARQAVSAALAAISRAPSDESRKGAETWLNELIWREFYLSILFHFPHVLLRAFRAQLAGIPWRNDGEDFAAWRQGRTGYPVVDAAMRQLSQTGWMPNRARMIVASFLVKNLLVDWRWGQRWFMQHLIDGDPAANNGGWQWVAGTGTDAAPYFRVFNPLLQGAKFDPQGDYVKRWLPELADLPAKFVHTPWKLPHEAAGRVGFEVGRNYPKPIVDLKESRQMALDAYARARQKNGR